MRIIFLLFVIITAGNCFSQDLIFTKDHQIEYVRIKEIEMGIIACKIWYLLDDVLKSVPLEEVMKIRYQNGNEVIVDSVTKVKRADSLDYAMIYFCYQSGNDESQNFPVYINGQYVAKLKNHMRLRLKVHSEGFLEINRLADGMPGPGVHITTAHGNFYGISINVPNTQKLAPTDRFRMKVYTGKEGFTRFLQTEFNTFKPFKKDDQVKEEDRAKPFIPGISIK
jgi:hypothetical protein